MDKDNIKKKMYYLDNNDKKLSYKDGYDNWIELDLSRLKNPKEYDLRDRCYKDKDGNTIEYSPF